MQLYCYFGFSWRVKESYFSPLCKGSCVFHKLSKLSFGQRVAGFFSVEWLLFAVGTAWQIAAYVRIFSQCVFQVAEVSLRSNFSHRARAENLCSVEYWNL